MKKKKIAKKKEKEAVEAPTAEDSISEAQLIETSCRIAFENCCSGRSAHDAILWDMIKTIRAFRGSPMRYIVKRLFVIGRRHGENTVMRQLVQADKDRNSYAMFCKRCGKRWNEHTEEGACTDYPRVVPETVEEIL